MLTLFTHRTLPALLFSGLIAFGAAAQAPNADAIARKAYGSRHDRVYLLGGPALPTYTELNARLDRSLFPKLQRGAVLLGVGYGQGIGSIGLGLEYRLALRANDVDSSGAYTSLTTNSLALIARYNLFVTHASTVSLLAGVTYNRLSLTMREGVSKSTKANSLFEAQLLSTNKRKLYQSQVGVAAGLQLERHFSWLRRNDAQGCGRARQIIVGVRVQADFVPKYYRWHTEQPLFRKSDKLDYKPRINPLGFSAVLTVGGLFNRY